MITAILAGGKGTRFLKLSKKPKILIKLNKKILADVYIDLIKKYGFHKIYFLLGHKNQKIIEHLKKNKFKIKVILEKKFLGTGGALKNIPITNNENILVIMGDILTNFNIKKFLQFHIKKKSDITLFVHPNNHPYDSDLVDIDDNLRVEKFYPKERKKIINTQNLATAGIYLVKSNLLKILKNNTKQDLSKDLIVRAISKQKKIFAYHSAEYVKDIGTPKRYYQAIEDIKLKKFKFNQSLKKIPAIFLDRDGVVNKEKKNFQYSNPCDFYPGIINAIKRINKSKYLCIIITNQPAIAKGFVSINYVEKSHKELHTKLGFRNVYIDDIFYCPHHPHKGFSGEIKKYKIKCNCRKPKIGMIMKAKKKYNIDLRNSIFVGNSTADYQLAKKAQLKPIIVNNNFLAKTIGQKKTFQNLNQFTNYFFTKKN